MGLLPKLRGENGGEAMNNRLPQYKPDYIISWDFSDTDCPCVSVSRIQKEERGAVCDVLGVSFEKNGVISLRQVCEEFEAHKRMEAERTQSARRAGENLPVKSEDKEVTEEQQKLYNQTVARLARGGAKSSTSQIIALAEEIEHYREKIQRMEAEP